MPRFIKESCIACGTCASVCPVDCITEGDPYVIDPMACIDCGTCEAECPTESIIEDPSF